MIKSWPDPNSLLHRSTLVLLNLTWHIYKDAVQGGRARQPFVEPKNALKVVFSRFCCTQIKFATIAPFCGYLTISSRLGQKESVFGSNMIENMDKRKLPSKHLKGQLDPPSVTRRFLHLRWSVVSPCCRDATVELQIYKMQLQKSLNNMVMVFSSWSITDRSFCNFLDGDDFQAECRRRKVRRWEHPKM